MIHNHSSSCRTCDFADECPDARQGYVCHEYQRERPMSLLTLAALLLVVWGALSGVFWLAQEVVNR